MNVPTVQKEEIDIDIDKISFNTNIIADSLYKTLKNSNFLVLKCYKLVFSIKGQINNIGSYMMSVLIFIFIILILIYIINGNKKISNFIHTILNQISYSPIDLNYHK